MATTDPTKKLVQDLSINLLSKLNKGVVKVEEPIVEKRSDAIKPLKKKDVIAGIVKEIESIGVKRLCDSLHISDASDICDALKINFKEKDGSQANKNRKNVVAKRFAKHVSSEGLEEVLTLLEEKHQKAVLEALEMPESSGTARAIAIRIASEVRRIGAEVMLSKMDMAFLKDLGEELSLDIHDLSSQTTIIKAILTGKVPAKRARVEKKQEPISKKKPKLEAGISIADMMQHYNLTELQDFARENEIMVSGKKKDLMKRIHDFFEGQTEPVSKKSKKDTPKKETKKDTPKKETKKDTPKKETKKEKKEDKKEDKEEEEAEAEAPKSPKKAAKKDAKKEEGKAKPKKDSKKEEEKAEEAEEKEEAEEEAPKEKASKSPKKVAKKDTKKSKEKVEGER